MARQEPETRERYRHFVSITTRWMDNDVYRPVFRNREGRAAAQGHFVHVACDRATQRPVLLPPEMRTALEKLRA